MVSQGTKHYFFSSVADEKSFNISDNLMKCSSLYFVHLSKIPILFFSIKLIAQVLQHELFIFGFHLLFIVSDTVLNKNLSQL